MDDSGVDFQLIQQCKEPIRRLCQNDASSALECLKVVLTFPSPFFKRMSTTFICFLRAIWTTPL
jgi:hypothetical protein